MIAIGVRSRRAAANAGLLAVLGAALCVGLAAWARVSKSGVYDASYTWLSLTLSFQGAVAFQSYSPAVLLRINHLNLVLAGAELAVAGMVVIWSRVGARGEPSLARYYGNQVLLLMAALGVVLSSDLASLFAFWGIAAIASYLLLAHNWSDEEASRGARLALAIPLLGDLSLLAGIAILWSRYAQLGLDQLIPILNTTPGAGPRALLVACVLIFCGAGVRLGLFPFQAWLTGTGASPAGAVAAVQGAWPVMVAALMYKVLPILVSSHFAHGAALRVVAFGAVVSAAGLPLLALTGQDARRAATAAAGGVSALGMLAFARPSTVGLAALVLAASGPGRAALLLGVGGLVNAMRTPLLGEMGEAWRRLRYTMAGLLIASAALVAAPGQAGAQGVKWWWAAAYAVCIVLAGLALGRLLFGAGLGVLVRRRGFDPARVREVADVMYAPAGLLALAAAALSLATFSTRILTFVDSQGHHHPAALSTAAFLAAGLGGLLLGYLVFGPARAFGAVLTGRLSLLWGFLVFYGALFGERYLVQPLVRIVDMSDQVLLDGGEAALGQELGASAAVARRRLPLLPIVLGAVFVLVIAGVLLAPGVYR